MSLSYCLCALFESTIMLDTTPCQDAINEAQRMPETVIIDATYKTNSHRMTYVNIVGTSNVSGNPRTTLKTYPIAGAWVEHETEENYLWVLSCLRDAVWPNDNNNNNNNNIYSVVRA
ncbi:hypothetical protein PHYBLDRAFT_153151 [Phycomyces blakesleeanus NRRL 1555(-)]|uniref:MULE transposase domain-containing protein n=1 Tax=Phycomyces blakesleeanus (strain ATCC 8743b / DSM 1359 / FGSC 10004 / NBRC 33097 / NRRL 1555) TaxID=763407 RepID=A0A162T284_PHYB8|nr:hypothetical protein PHYBLDRAFT_153151 [Phycomyces blakesleeanus NRRL 1555(-)]OAD65672.1 hypothetical protein PHYBLDRAFT_153151 [Phycomyces blakesleeanus NRRL 1555(-)]|eukprot:XP_018283712.1 hypothetical protein PHYBLDRAFT_153151 [Phycomyces blakesleeanus NRRL 1555(-)]